MEDALGHFNRRLGGVWGWYVCVRFCGQQAPAERKGNTLSTLLKKAAWAVGMLFVLGAIGVALASLVPMEAEIRNWSLLAVLLATASGLSLVVVKAILLNGEIAKVASVERILFVLGLSFLVRLVAFGVPLMVLRPSQAQSAVFALCFFAIYLVQLPIEMRYVLQRKPVSL